MAAQGPIEKKVRKAATDAVRSVKSSVKGAVAAVQRAAKRAVKQVSNPQPAGRKAAATVAGKTTRKPAAKKAAPKSRKEESREAGGEKDGAEGSEDEIASFARRPAALVSDPAAGVRDFRFPPERTLFKRPRSGRRHSVSRRVRGAEGNLRTNPSRDEDGIARERYIFLCTSLAVS